MAMHCDVEDFPCCRGLCLGWSAWRGRTSMSAASAVAKWMLSGRCACSPFPLTSASPCNALSLTSRYSTIDFPSPHQGSRRLSSADCLHLLHFEDARFVRAIQNAMYKEAHLNWCSGINVTSSLHISFAGLPGPLMPNHSSSLWICAA